MRGCIVRMCALAVVFLLATCVPTEAQFQANPYTPVLNQSSANVFRNEQNTPYPANRDYGSQRRDPFRTNVILAEPTYFVVSSRMVRPSQVYRVFVSILKSPYPLSVRASLLRDGVDMGSEAKLCREGIPETLLIQVPPTSVEGRYRLRVEGNENGMVGGTAFVNETDLIFSQRSMTIFIQTDKPVYKQNEIVRFRIIPINTELKAFNDAIDVYMKDPNGVIVRRWLSRQSNFGAVSLDYPLSDLPVFGNWTIRVIALGQVEEEKYLVEEYYQTRFEVNVTMPAFFFDTDSFLYGTIMANYTSGGPVSGNLTIQANIRPIKPAYRNYGGSEPILSTSYRYTTNASSDYYPYTERRLFYPYFYGRHEFFFSMRELEGLVPQLDGMEVMVTASVGAHYLDEVVSGFAVARIFNSSLQATFLGGTPQVFKPTMPFTCYVAVSYYDGSPLTGFEMEDRMMRIRPEVYMNSGGGRTLEAREAKMLADQPGIWKIDLDLKSELGADQRRVQEALRDVSYLRVSASFRDNEGRYANGELLVYAHYSPGNKHIGISTSTANPKVGEYIVLHARTNFYLEEFNYIVLSKGMILLTGTEQLQASIKTFAITLSAEMSPAATVVVYHVTRYGETVADSLTFPVNGISRNNFTVALNNRKEKTGNYIEVIVRGEPGAYVGLSGIDRAFYSMQAGNEISHAEVLNKMITFDEDSNGTLTHVWTSREGMPEEVVYFPSQTFGIDANRTFEYSGLVVFSDVVVARRDDFCNYTAGYAACLSGQCYRVEKRCDGIYDCQDGTDESKCMTYNKTEMAIFRKFRFNRLERLYQNVWLWRDINIGPLGHYIFTVPVPRRPALWMVSAFGMSPKTGFGLIKKPIMYSGVRPFFIDVEMPNQCRQGEQVGIRVTIFNYMTEHVEPMVILANSPDYKFVVIEAYGIVQSYNPRTYFGEHQVLVWIAPQDATVVYFPIVPTRLGEISVTVKAHALIARDQVTRLLRVEPDGVPQFRHSAVLLDLSNRAYVFQFMHVNISETPIIPYEYDRYYVYGSNKAVISVVGDIVGPAFPTLPVNSTSVLSLPMDCAEQNMFGFAASVYTAMYMRLTNQDHRRINKEAFHQMNLAYQRQLSFQQPDGSFSFFRSDWNNSESSVWLTAYIARVFQEASFNEWENYLYIDPEVISRAVGWLLQFQNDDGAFMEVAPWFADRKVNSTLNWPRDHIRFRNISLTAHVLVTLQQAKNLPGEVGPRVSWAKARAMHWLEVNLNLLDAFGSPYEAAIVSYALLISKSAKGDEAFGILAKHARREGGYIYWGDDAVPLPSFKLENNKPFLLPRLPFNHDSANVETTAYALMVYNLRQEMFIDPIVKWLNSQRLHDGGWSSTQDTAAAMRGLIDYTVRSRIRDVTTLTVSIESVALPGVIKTIHIDQNNLAQRQILEIPGAWGTVKVEAKGAGYAILQMSSQYNVDKNVFMTPPPVPAFQLDTRASFYGRNASHILYRSCQKWIHLNESDRSGMAVLEVSIPTGYYMQQQRLDKYVLSNRVRNLRRARYTEQKVFFYFDYLDQDHICVNFTVERWYPVANMTRYLPIKVYDYYAPERFKEIIFDAFDTYSLDICQVCGSYQCPYCPIYNRAHPRESLSPLFLLLSSAVLCALRYGFAHF